MHDDQKNNPLLSDIECDFCTELNGGTDCLFQDVVNDVDISRVALRNGGLSIFPCLGMLTDGHLLISPNYHTTSCFQLSHADAINLPILINVIRNRMIKDSGKCPVFFEHGNPTECESSSSACIDHAHLHILPFDPGMLETIQLERQLIGTSPLNSNPLHYAQVNEPYLMFLDTNLVMHFFSTDNAPRQYLRYTYAKLIGKPDLGAWIPNISAEQTVKNANYYRGLFN